MDESANAVGGAKSPLVHADYGGMVGHDPGADIAENYRRFATHEAAGRSPAYERLANAVADDPDILSFLEALPPEKRQPNLLFAAARYLLRAPADHDALRRLVHTRQRELSAVMRVRRTQTNEAARCAVFLPALATLPQPLALLEVGPAAGLTLLPDLYSYDYGGHVIEGLASGAPVLACRPSETVPLPDAVPTVTWRAGIDINPLDVDDEDDMAWLGCLLWPGEEGRAQRLASAINLARQVRPRIEQGDLLGDLERVAQAAPPAATLVVYHSAVLAYIGSEKRQAFAAAVGDLGAVWLSLEGTKVLANVSPPEGSPPGFLLVRDGREVLATADAHGAWINWKAEQHLA